MIEFTKNDKRKVKYDVRKGVVQIIWVAFGTAVVAYTAMYCIWSGDWVAVDVLCLGAILGFVATGGVRNKKKDVKEETEKNAKEETERDDKEDAKEDVKEQKRNGGD